MVRFSFAIIFFLLLAVPGIAGLALLIIGLIKKRAALWGSGLGIMVVSGLLFLVMLFVGLFYLRSARVAAPPPSAVSAPPLAVTAPADLEAFEHYTGLPAPEGAELETGIEMRDDAGPRRCRLKLKVTPAFGDFLEAHFRKASWADVRGALTARVGARPGSWITGRTEGMVFYTRRHVGDAGQQIVTSVAYDKSAGVAYVAGVRRGN